MKIPTPWRRWVCRSVVASTAFLCACGSDSPFLAQNSVQNDLVFTREDGSRIHFDAGSSISVTCGPWESNQVPVESLRITFAGRSEKQPGWTLKAVLDDVTLEEPLAFPNSFVWNQPRNVDVFVSDPPNECSTSSADSGGSLMFQELRCGINGRVRFSIDAVIGSEYGDAPSIRVQGTFEAPVDPASNP